MESYYAKIENGIVTSVEVVTDDFFNSNPSRYTGTWKKVGNEIQPFVGKGYVHLEAKDKIIQSKPFESWSLDETKDEWKSPIKKPEGDFIWNEEKQEWVPFILSKD